MNTPGVLPLYKPASGVAEGICDGDDLPQGVVRIGSGLRKKYGTSQITAMSRIFTHVGQNCLARIDKVSYVPCDSVFITKQSLQRRKYRYISPRKRSTFPINLPAFV